MTKRTVNLLPVVLNAALEVYLTPKIAADVALDLKPVIRGVSPATWAANKPRVRVALDAALKGKLAQDADVDDVMDILGQLDDVKEQAAEAVAGNEATDPGDPDAEDANGDMMDRLMEFLSGKLSDEDLVACKTLMKPEVDPAATDGDVPAALKDKKMPAKDATPDKQPPGARTSGPAGVTEQAMDAAISAAVSAATQATIDRLRGVQAAERRCARGWASWPSPRTARTRCTAWRSTRSRSTPRACRRSTPRACRPPPSRTSWRLSRSRVRPPPAGPSPWTPLAPRASPSGSPTLAG